MDTTWLRDFLVLAEHQNFSRAAQERNVTQPAFSRRIQALERWVGTPLFDRSTHILTLTKAGVAFHSRAEESLRLLMQGREVAREEGEVYEPTVRFAATHALALTFFSGWIRKILETLKQAPRIQLAADNMKASERLMIGGQANFLLCYYHPSMAVELNSSQFRSICIGHDRLIPVSVPDAAGAPLYRLADNADSVPHLAYGEQSGLGRILHAHRTKQPLPVRLKTVFTSHMASVLIAVAKDGTGLAWAPRHLVEDDLKAGRLVRAGDTAWDAPIQIELFRPKSPQNAAAEAVWGKAVEYSKTTRPLEDEPVEVVVKEKRRRS